MYCDFFKYFVYKVLTLILKFFLFFMLFLYKLSLSKTLKRGRTIVNINLLQKF